MDGIDTARGIRLLTDPTRLRILGLILESADGRALVGRLAGELGLTQPTVSHHVKALLDEGVLDRSPDGRRVWYSIAPAAADRVNELLQTDAATHASDEVLERIAPTSPRGSRASSRPRPSSATCARATTCSPSARGSRATCPRSPRGSPPTGSSALAKQRRDGEREPPEVLFVCVQNAGRSQIAAAILQHLAGDRVRCAPRARSRPSAIKSTIVAALDEIGVPIGGEFPKPLTDEVVRAADVVITMGCGDACPVYPGRRYLDWDLHDPAGLPLARVREIRDDIDARVRTLLAELGVNAGELLIALGDEVQSIDGHLCFVMSKVRTMSAKPTVLFVCVHNAGRSQMAAGYLRDSRGGPRRGAAPPAPSRRPDQPDRDRGDGRRGHRHRRQHAEDPHHRRRQGIRCRDHHGLRRRLPDLPRQALRGLGARGPGRQGPSRPCAASATTSSGRVEALLAEILPATV